MRVLRLACLLSLVSALAPGPAAAKPWQGINPGASSQNEVVEKFGEPTTRTKRGAKSVLAYLGEQALPGTKQTQFYVSEDGTVQEITVFIATQLDKDAIEGTYGKSPEKTFTDAFLPVWIYRAAGVTVYFGKDGTVEAITFGAGVKSAPRAEGAPAKPAAAKPAAARPAAAKGGAQAP